MRTRRPSLSWTTTSASASTPISVWISTSDARRSPKNLTAGWFGDLWGVIFSWKHVCILQEVWFWITVFSTIHAVRWHLQLRNSTVVTEIVYSLCLSKMTGRSRDVQYDSNSRVIYTTHRYVHVHVDTCMSVVIELFESSDDIHTTCAQQLASLRWSFGCYCGELRSVAYSGMSARICTTLHTRHLVWMGPKWVGPVM